MDTRSAVKQVQEAHGILTQAIVDATVCRLDVETSDLLGESSPSWFFLPDPTALRSALTALDGALGQLGAMADRPGPPVIDLVPIAHEVPGEAVFARVPAQRRTARPA